MLTKYFKKLLYKHDNCYRYWTDDLNDARRIIKIAQLKGMPLVDNVFYKINKEEAISDNVTAVSFRIKWKAEYEGDFIGLYVNETYCNKCNYHKTLNREELMKGISEFMKKHGGSQTGNA